MDVDLKFIPIEVHAEMNSYVKWRSSRIGLQNNVL